MRITLPLALGLLLGCTNDYDQFNVGGTTNQGAGPAGGAPTGAGPAGGAPTGAGPEGGAPTGAGPAGGMGGDGGTPPIGGEGGMGGVGGEGGMGGVGGMGGMGGMGGEGGGGIVNGVACGNGVTCDLDAGQVCCIPEDGGTVGTCKTSCAGNEATIECDEPADCPGVNEFCCADLSGNTQQIECHVGFCNSGDIFLCGPPPDDECGPFTCMDATNLPDPIMTCQ
jgi:hypothetical protein